MPKPKTLLGKFIIWRIRNIPHTQFLFILCIITGFISGMSAVVLKNATHLIQSLLHKDFIGTFYTYGYIFFPFIGISIAVIISKYIIAKPIGHGIPSTLYAISKQGGLLKSHQMYASILTAPFTVGFGGSVGLEGPTVATGSALGSNISRVFRMNYKNRILLIGCAATGAMSVIFNAPIAAIIFSIEVFSLDLTLTSLLPLLFASISARLTSYFFMGNDVLLHFSQTEVFDIRDTMFYVLLGVVSSITSIYFNKMYMFIASLFDKLQSSFKKLIIGGVLIGIIVFFIPPLFGEGFDVINNLLAGSTPKSMFDPYFAEFTDNQWVVILLLLGLVVFKIIATSITFGAGGIGGIFTPTLFMGSAMGNVFSKIVNAFGFYSISEVNFTLVGMAGLMSGVLYAPLTAIFLIAEITRGYSLFLPLMITSSISYSITKYFIHRSVYTSELDKKGELLTHNKDRAILNMLNIKSLLETNFITISSKMSISEILHSAVAKSKRNIFPVVDSKGYFEGIVSLNDIRHIMFETSICEVSLIKDVMQMPETIIDIKTDSIENVMKKFQDTAAWNLPVTDDDKYVGFISKSKLLGAYRRKLIMFSSDD
ncbi:chloride channel protein [Ichthyobacterium seriolicida]|uniref:Chloride channel protein n=1 Tax=Ichthyobacterium seriolicida TaxID=242600 RepID=A0A1J1DWA1_9FLAO|nr:chloride channel protein [Ichthyobacterium seriolicida]BAV94143.1 chloride channel protein [Ichthyobacterium seriolicida]